MKPKFRYVPGDAVAGNAAAAILKHARRWQP